MRAMAGALAALMALTSLGGCGNQPTSGSTPDPRSGDPTPQATDGPRRITVLAVSEPYRQMHVALSYTVAGQNRTGGYARIVNGPQYQDQVVFDPKRGPLTIQWTVGIDFLKGHVIRGDCFIYDGIDQPALSHSQVTVRAPTDPADAFCKATIFR